MTPEELDEIEARKSAEDIPRIVRFIRRQERVDMLAEHLLTHHMTYHDHKEKIAHAVLLVQVAIFGAVASVTNWPPALVSSAIKVTDANKIWITFVVLFIVWVFSHGLLRWQLFNRRRAALQYAGVLSAVTDWALSSPDDAELRPSGKLNKGSRFDRISYLIVNFLIPFQASPSTGDSIEVRPEVPDEGNPTGIVNRIRNQKGNPAWQSEWVLTIASYIVLIGLGLRSWPPGFLF